MLSDPDGPAVLGLATTHPSRWFDEALHFGIDGVVCLPRSPSSSVWRWLRPAPQRHRRGSTNLHASGALRSTRDAHVFTIFSTKGGSGKTVIATNLAVSFARDGKRTLLIDFDLHSGDDALVLGLSPRWTVLDLVQSPGRSRRREAGRVRHPHSSGVDLLPGPTRPDEEELVAIDRLEPLLEVARDSL